MGSSWKKDMGKTVKQQLARINTKVSASASGKQDTYMYMHNEIH
jgi:uncharacterized protein YecE (DUF72 family)